MSVVNVDCKFEVLSLGESLGSEDGTELDSSNGLSVGNFDGKIEVSSVGEALEL